jgi:predicted ferric reductase
VAILVAPVLIASFSRHETDNPEESMKTMKAMPGHSLEDRLDIEAERSERVIRGVGFNFALIGFTMLALQFVIASRFRWIEGPFGLDILIAFHRKMAVVATALLISHPLLLSWADREWTLLTHLNVEWSVNVGRAALFAVLLTVVISLYRQAFRLSFEKWRNLHNGLALSVLGLGFIHSLFTGNDLESGFLRWFWMALLAVALVSYLYHRGPLHHVLGKHSYAYEITDLRQETHDTWTVEMRAKDERRIQGHRAGQFHFLTMQGESLPVEEHPFTISSAPSEKGMLASTIKQSGDFTQLIGRARIGDTVSVRGPFGRFCHDLHPPENHLVFVAGGVGITPFISMLRQMRHTGDQRNVTLIYSNRSESDIIFNEELDDLTRSPGLNLKVVHVLSRAADQWPGERGRIGKDLIERYVAPEPTALTYFICGPVGMMETTIDVLRQFGVLDRQIVIERFWL